MAEMENQDAKATRPPSSDGEADGPSTLEARRKRVFEVIEVGRGDNHLSRLFDGFIVTLIIANITAFCLETVPSINAKWGTWLNAFETLSIAIFTVEYVLRLWCAVELPFLRRLPPWKARITYARQPDLLIDLLAILPYYLSLLLPVDLRVIRILRLLRFFKLSRYSPAIHTLIRVLSSERRTLTGAGILMLSALLISATGMYYIEGTAQPDKFGSVPDAAYWAATTLTTVGYGDVSPITPLGKAWAMLTMVMGLCVLALPVAIITSGFAQEAGRRDFVVTWSLMARVPMLASLDANEVATIMPLLHAQSVPPNFDIITAGSRGDAMYFVAAGQLKFRDPQTQIDYATGDCFGAIALLEGGTHSGTCSTVTRCRLLKLFREDFARLEAATPAVASKIRAVAKPGGNSNARN